MLCFAHLVLIHVFVILFISYLFDSSYNDAEGHYYSVSGLMLQNRVNAHFLGCLAAFALYHVYSCVSRKLDIAPAYAVCTYAMAIGVLVYDLDTSRVMHFVFLFTFMLSLTAMNAMVFRAVGQYYMHFAVYCTVTLLFALVVAFAQPWANIHTALELLWLSSIYYIVCVLSRIATEPEYSDEELCA